MNVAKSSTSSSSSSTPGTGSHASAAAQFALGAALVREERRRDAHLVQVGVGGELHQVRDLPLPTELPDHDRAGREVGDHVRPPGRAGSPEPLQACDRLEGGVGHGIDEAETEERRGSASRDDRRFRRHLLADVVAGALDADAVGLDQRPAGIAHVIEGAVLEGAEAHFDEIAAAADSAGAVALAARRAVEDRAEPVIRGFFFRERGAAGLKLRQLRTRQSGYGVAVGGAGRAGGGDPDCQCKNESGSSSVHVAPPARGVVDDECRWGLRTA
jgi:hypothetical protein